MTPGNALDAARMSRLKTLFADALTLSSEDRPGFIRESTDGDEVLERELASLLDAHDHSDSWFARFAEDVITPALHSIDLESVADAGPATSMVSHYELIERIGGGGMGVVYKARDTHLGRLVALKFLPRHHASNPAARAQLVAEARAASRLDHPNIGVVYEIGKTGDDREFIAMGWYEGETLRTRIKRGPLPINDSVGIALQLASALDAAHGAGIVHRDVKPANVIVTPSGTAKLLDFGIAKLTSEEDGARQAMAGTLAYMSPEQTADAPLDRRTDIWSLGVVLFEMLAGHRPFRADTNSDQIAEIRKAAPPSISAIRPDVDPRLSAIVAQCLRKDPGERFQSARELSDALVEWRAGSGVTDHSGIARAHGLRRVMLAAVALVVVGAVAGTWIYSRDNLETRSAAALASPFKIAVLPFEASTADTSQSPVDALAEDLRTELSRIPTVVVPSTFSSEPFAASRRPIPDIARELGARYIVTGTVASTNGGAHLKIRVIDGTNDRALATREYASRDNGGPDIVRQVAAGVIELLDVPLRKDERVSTSKPRFANEGAYKLYLRGLHEELAGQPRTSLGAATAASIRAAQALYTQARSLDPSIAPLRSRLALTHILAAERYDTTQARLDQARLEAETALRLDPLLWEARVALAKYWAKIGDAPKATAELESAEKLAPNNVLVLLELGHQYRIVGRWEDAISMIERARQLDPHNPAAHFLAATTYGRMRRYPEAMKAHSKVLETWPNDYEVRQIKGQAYLRWKGSPDTLFSELAKIPEDWDVRGMATYGRYTAFRVAKKYREGIAMLDRTKTTLSRDGIVYYPKSLMKAELYHDLGDEANARRYYEIARREMLDSLKSRPGDASIRSSLALAYAGLGRKQEAIAQAENAMNASPLSRNGPVSTAFMGSAVEVFARVGELDRAFEKMELLLTMNSGRDMPLPLIEAWPGYAPLRKDPRYTELVKRFSSR